MYDMLLVFYVAAFVGGGMGACCAGVLVIMTLLAIGMVSKEL